ncbi:MAG: c-type cytochrome [Campylobacterales bacterium]|nr:c-type cytochrome [Campylobacterales bacterium]
MISSATIEETSSAESEPKVLSAGELYHKCASCHGTGAEKSALGKSQVIAGWDAQKTIDAIIGYQNGTYGGPMKALMGAQVKNLSDEEIQALARYIAAL